MKPIRVKHEPATNVVKQEEIDGCRAAIAWSWRALGTGLAVLEMSKPELQEAMSGTGVTTLAQVLKLLLTDEAYEESRSKLRKLAIDRLISALVDRGHPETQALIQSDIDFSLIPDAPGLSAEYVNAIRP